MPGFEKTMAVSKPLKPEGQHSWPSFLKRILRFCRAGISDLTVLRQRHPYFKDGAFGTAR
jgi:hypothetical protein